ncbi:MAG: hypothetical protein AAF587_38740 [Bacteroidota bacterium]
MFQSRDFDNCELTQVEKILQLDLACYTKYPVNYLYDSSELEYRLYLAQKESDEQKTQEIQEAIERGKKEWEQSYDDIHEGWTTVEEFRQTTIQFIERIKQNPDFGQQINTPSGWDYPWDDYFTYSPIPARHNQGVTKDLEVILLQLDCMEMHGIAHVAIWGQ